MASQASAQAGRSLARGLAVHREIQTPRGKWLVPDSSRLELQHPAPSAPNTRPKHPSQTPVPNTRPKHSSQDTRRGLTVGFQCPQRRKPQCHDSTTLQLLAVSNDARQRSLKATGCSRMAKRIPTGRSVKVPSLTPHTLSNHDSTNRKQRDRVKCTVGALNRLQRLPSVCSFLSREVLPSHSMCPRSEEKKALDIIIMSWRRVCHYRLRSGQCPQQGKKTSARAENTSCVV